MTFFAKYPVVGGVSGVAIYANLAAFPLSALDGALAVDKSNDYLYAFNLGTSSWVLIANHATIALAAAATSSNTPSTLVLRDGSGNFSAGTITASLTGNASGTAANVTGVVAVANGGTGVDASSALAGLVFASPTAAPGPASFRALAATDIPSLDAAKVTSGAFDAARIPSLDAAKITTGVLDIGRVPPAALERMVVVADQVARYALTTAIVQNGDTVLQTDITEMFMVADETQLGVAAGYVAYAAGTAAALMALALTDAMVSNSAAIAWSKISKSGAVAGDIGAAPSLIALTPEAVNFTAAQAQTYLVDTTASRSIQLPSPAVSGTWFALKDVSGLASTNPITLVRFAAEKIENVAASKVLSTNYGYWRFVSDGTNWWVMP